MANIGLGNTPGQLSELGAEVIQQLKLLNLAIQPEELYVIKGVARELTFENGTAIALHDNKPALVVIVLNKAQAAGIGDGVTDVRNL